MFAISTNRKFGWFLRVCMFVCLLAGLLIPAQSVFAALLTNKIADLVQTGTGEMGFTVSLSGDWAAVGAPGTSNSRGAAYVYNRNQGGANQWGLVHVFSDPTPANNERYGYAVAIYADPANPSSVTLAVGARDESTLGKFAGAVYVYNRDQGGVDSWGMLQTLQTTPSVAKGDRFGSAVVLWNDTIVVGAPYEDTDPGAPNRAGSAFLFTRGANGQYTHTGKVTGLQINDRFGTGVAISGNTLAVGAPNNNSSGISKSGAVYHYQRDTSGAWIFQNMLYANTPISSEAFGTRVAISANTANTLVVGAPGADGAAYIFERTQGTNVWGAPRKLSGVAYTSFGSGVALDGDVIAVGAPAEGGMGAFHVFSRNQDGLNTWGSAGTVTLTGGAANDLFGSALSLQNNLIVAGAPGRSNQGAAFVYSMNFTLELDLNGAAAGYDFAADYTEDSAAVAIVDPAALTITDLDGLNLHSATVTISNLLDGSAEQLSAQPNGATTITQDWIRYTAGVLTIQSPVPGATAPLSDFQAVLRSVRYANTAQNPTEGARAVQFVANDGTENSNSAVSLVTVHALDDAPILAVPATVQGAEDSNISLAGMISVSDVDSSQMAVTLTANSGTLTLGAASGLTFTTGDGTADAQMAFTGSVTDINAAFNNAFFRPTANYYGPASLTITVSDQASASQGGPLTDSETIAITVNPAIDPSQVQFYINAPSPMRVNVPYDVFFTVTSPAAFPGKPTGTVTVTAMGTGANCQGTLVNGQGSCKLTVQVTGNYSIQARYGGDNDFAPSTAELAFFVDYQKLQLPVIIR